MQQIEKNKQRLNPWFWIPTLYFAEGIPYYMVNVISVIIFNKMGLPNGIMALYTSMLYLPWVIKPLWSPFIDIIRSKRWWVTSMQAIISVCFIALVFSLPRETPVETISPFRFTLVLFWIVAFASATHDIAADGFYMLGLDEGEQSLFVGIRSTFYRLASIFGQGVLVVVAGLIETRSGDIPFAWTVTLAIVATIYSAMALWHISKLPKPISDKPKEGKGIAFVMIDFLRSFTTFFSKKHIIPIMFFLLLYRLPQAFLTKMINPFLLDPVSEGGLGLTTQQVGIAYGTIGVAALTVSGILGGMAVAKWGLKKCIWPMAMSVTLPSLAFIWMSIAQPQNFWVISLFVALDQIGYGFGFTAYMLYMIYVSQGEFKTSHYSLCTAFMALSMMLPGMVAGYIEESIGYVGFFITVGACCAVTALVTLAVKVEPEYGKKIKALLIPLTAIGLAFSAGTTSANAQSINCSSPIVRSGIEVLRDNGFAPLKGKRIGLITNPSGVDSQLKSTIEILHEAEGVELVALFGPEHGVRGDKWAGEKAEDSIDPETGLPVYSLYGAYRKPAARMLKGLDAIVYDIQDVGSRSYTFISTMGLAMAACAELDIEFIILDRPNPLGGEKVEGCYVEQPYNSFVSQYRIPYIYGLTPGEVALLINGEGLNRGQKGNETPAVCRLTVIPMDGWKRDMTYSDTGLPWMPTSPNIPSPDAAIAYSCAGICGEIGRFLNIGIGYTLPFQTFAADWIDPVELKAELESYNLAGISFREIYYRPFAGSGSGRMMKGVQYFFTDYSKASLTLLQFYVMQAVSRLYPEKKAFKVGSSTGLFDKVCGTDYVRKVFGQRYEVSDIMEYWQKDVEEFKELSKKYYLY